MDNEKAYEFINSEEIREHLRKLNYSLTPVQCAFLVWQSKHHTMKQKHEAWNDIIVTQPDCTVEERCNFKGWDSLHDMLRGYIAFEQKILTLFLDEDHNAFYEYELWTPSLCKDGIAEYQWSNNSAVFYCFEDCYQSALNQAKEESCRFRIAKRFIYPTAIASGCTSRIRAEYNQHGDILEINLSGNPDVFSLTEEEFDLWSDSFEGMWFDIPIPFKKGDIVCDNSNIYTEGVPFVLLGTVPWYRKEHPPRNSLCSDYTDMCAYGYAYDRTEQFFNDDFRVDYLNLEYYKSPIEGSERLIAAYSQFVKGEISGYTLLKLFRMIEAESTAEKERIALEPYLATDIQHPLARER